MSQNRKSPIPNENEVKITFRYLDESNDESNDESSSADIRKYLSSVYQAIPDFSTIKQYLKNAVDKGALLNLDNGNYEIKETARRKKSRSRSRSRGKSKGRSRSRKRSERRRRSRSGTKRRKRSSNGKRRRKRSASGRRRKRPSSAKRRRSRRTEAIAGDDVE